MKDRAETLLNALGDHYGHLATVAATDEGDGIRLVVTGLDGRTIGLATVAQIQQTCIEHGYLPYAQDTDLDDRVLTIDCRTGAMVQGVVDRVTLDQDGLLVKLEGDVIHCVPLPPVGDVVRRRLLMTRSGDPVTIRLIEDDTGERRVAELRNHALGEA